MARRKLAEQLAGELGETAIGGGADIAVPEQVGGLYHAYNEIMEYALDQGYRYVHIIQHDMQLLFGKPPQEARDLLVVVTGIKKETEHAPLSADRTLV